MFAAIVPGESSKYAEIRIVGVHVLVRSSRCGLAEIDLFIRAIRQPDRHEPSATNARVIHANDADAEGGTHELEESESVSGRYWRILTASAALPPCSKRSTPIRLQMSLSVATAPLWSGACLSSSSGTGLAPDCINSGLAARANLSKLAIMTARTSARVGEEKRGERHAGPELRILNLPAGCLPLASKPPLLLRKQALVLPANQS